MRFLLLLCLASTSCIFRSPNCDDDVLFTIQDGTYTSSMSALRGTVNSVSYTHLTLPTNREV